jgi:hypothetical protein
VEKVVAISTFSGELKAKGTIPDAKSVENVITIMKVPKKSPTINGLSESNKTIF